MNEATAFSEWVAEEHYRLVDIVNGERVWESGANGRRQTTAQLYSEFKKVKHITMAKPIFAVRCNVHDVPPERMKVLGEELERRLPDYHVLLIADVHGKPLEFECYNVTDADEISFEEFKKQVHAEIVSVSAEKVP